MKAMSDEVGLRPLRAFRFGIASRSLFLVILAKARILPVTPAIVPGADSRRKHPMPQYVRHDKTCFSPLIVDG